MMVIGLAMYSFVGLLLGAGGGLIIGVILSILGQLQVGKAKPTKSAPDETTELSKLASPNHSDTSGTGQISDATVESRFVQLVAILAVGLYGLSLLLPAIGTSGGYNQAQLGLSKQNPGFWILILSMANCFVLNPMWLANPLAWTGAFLLAKRSYRAAAVTSMLASVAALAGVWLFMQVTNGGDQYDLLVGCYIWIASIVVLAVGSTLAACRFPNRWSKVNAQ
ncbi:hypothetical protein SH528x_003554 [Novipirellula sp. SH528]|uniref:hypothetical protein n=1 Tax=Novipirellula sp. SH528 TaxID=3454466 RepID=UPI003F9FC820